MNAAPRRLLPWLPTAILAVAFFAAATSLGESPTPTRRPPAVRGVALGLFANDPSHDYEPQLREIADLGASHVAIVVTHFQREGEESRPAVRCTYCERQYKQPEELVL